MRRTRIEHQQLTVMKYDKAPYAREERMGQFLTITEQCAMRHLYGTNPGMTRDGAGLAGAELATGICLSS